MLEELSIKNFAIIDELTIPFDTGLTVLTGETGAGKSIIIDAIGLLIGGRGSVEYVRHGRERAEIEGLFDVSSSVAVRQKLMGIGIEVEENMIVLRRHITDKGKSVCRINGKLVTLAILREVGHALVDIHGQHEHQDLMQPDKHLPILDRFAGEELQEALSDYKKRYQSFAKLMTDLQKYKENDQEATSRLDFIRFQLEEIEQARLTPGEDEELEKEKHILVHSQKLFKELSHAYESLYGEGRTLDWAGQAMAHTEEAAFIDEDVQNLTETIHSAYYMLEEATFLLRDKVESLSFNEGRLQEVEERLDEIKKLKRKYGQTVIEILEFAADMEEEMESLIHKDETIAQLESQLESVVLDLQADAATLTDLRRQAGEKLASAVEMELKDLYMNKAVMKVEVTAINQGTTFAAEQKSYVFNENGQDKVEFQLSANAGEPLKPLSKVASGGEISRIMLALKAILSDFQNVTSLIFDEVDTGVSGRVAQAIAEKIYKVAKGSQVLCISHLPQVAAMADQHLYIEKKEKGERVLTNVTMLKDDKRTDEIARMISGVEVTDLTKENAKELLEMAVKIKSN
ncbi:DNA repair protein RecN [Bacillus piscicola]|uniref:DNA repair protein RecN n=1 Tax=Bacillus piscicola TaxID=1632684 RepID=UPI001F091777|nr:DNA repair protein RecN [Bacillus piscicola]